MQPPMRPSSSTGSVYPSTRGIWAAQISVEGRALKAEENLIVFGISVVARGPPEYHCRIAKAWFAFHAQGGRLTSKSLSLGARWERWLRHASPALSFGSWRWLWDDTTESREEATVDRMIRNAVGLRRPEDDGWLSPPARTLRDA